MDVRRGEAASNSVSAVLETQREAVARACHRLAAAGLVPGASGNVSVREGDVIAVTRAGTALGRAEAADVSVVDLEGRLLAGAAPTSELLVHLGVYAELGAGAIVHSHASAAIAAAETGAAIDLPGESVPVAPQRPEGSPELAAAVLEAFGRGTDAVVMTGHGTVVHGPDLAAAVSRTEALERACAALGRRG